MVKFTDLAKRLAEKHNLDKKNVESFLAAFADVLQQGIASEGQVKIKGLGTFKIVKVKDRESVDVNTGERLLIQGHEKLSFTPDAVMKEMVNRPFAQFESVVIKDDVVFDDLEEPKAKVEEKEEETFQIEPQPEEKPIESIAELAEISHLEHNENQDNEENNEVIEPVVEEVDLPAPEEEKPEEVIEKAAIAEEEPPAKEFEKTIDEEKNLPDEEVEVEEQAEDIETIKARKNKKLMRNILCLIAGLLIGLWCGYLIFNEKEANKSDKNSVNVVNADTINSSDTIVKKETSTAKETVVDYEAKQKEYEEKYPEVRYGYYKIVGVDKTVTAKADQTLAAISRSHLGPGMLCYVIAINDGIKEVKEGQIVKIPKLAAKKLKNKRR